MSAAITVADGSVKRPSRQGMPPADDRREPAGAGLGHRPDQQAPLSLIQRGSWPPRRSPSDLEPRRPRHRPGRRRPRRRLHPGHLRDPSATRAQGEIVTDGATGHQARRLPLARKFIGPPTHTRKSPWLTFRAGGPHNGSVRKTTARLLTIAAPGQSRRDLRGSRRQEGPTHPRPIRGHPRLRDGQRRRRLPPRRPPGRASRCPGRSSRRRRSDSSQPAGREIAARLAVKTDSARSPTPSMSRRPTAGSEPPVRLRPATTITGRVTRHPDHRGQAQQRRTGEGRCGSDRSGQPDHQRGSRAARARGSAGPTPASPPVAPNSSKPAIIVSVVVGRPATSVPVEAFADSLVPRSAPRPPPSTRGGIPTARSIRPANRSARNSMSPLASPARSSTGPACRRPRRSSRSTRIPGADL